MFRRSAIMMFSLVLAAAPTSPAQASWRSEAIDVAWHWLKGLIAREHVVPPIRGGSSAELARALNVPEGYAAHHVIPAELGCARLAASTCQPHPVLRRVGIDLDAPQNGIALPTREGLDARLPLHRGSHPGYTQGVSNLLGRIPDDIPVEQQRLSLHLLQEAIKNCLREGVPVHLVFGAPSPWTCTAAELAVATITAPGR